MKENGFNAIANNILGYQSICVEGVL